MIVRDLFCGGGGWSVGAALAGLTDITGYDNDIDAITTYTDAGFTGVHTDLTTTPSEPCDLLLASPPCQPYSSAGKRQGRSDSRAMLPLVVATWAAAQRPTAIAVEQVEGASSVINRLAAMLAVLGYKVVLREVNAEAHGVPQARRRIVLMAHLHRKPGVPVATHSVYDRRNPRRLQRGVLPWVSMADALGIPPEVSMGDVKTSNGTVRSADQPSPTIMAGMDNGNWRWVAGQVVGFPRADDQGGDGYRERDLRPVEQPSFAVTSKVRSWTRLRPSPTIVGSFHPEVVAAPGYRVTTSRQNTPNSVVVTVEEAAVLQGFARGYPWHGSQTSKYRQVGNAFPPPVAKAVIEELL